MPKNLRSLINASIAALFLFSIAAAQQIAITGKVIDTAGNPISGVRVRLAQAGVPVDTTGADGQFSIIRVPTNAGPGSMTRKPSFSHNTLHFSVSKNCRATALLFSLDGKRTATILDHDENPGDYSIAVERLIANVPSGVYLLKVRINGETSSFKVLRMNSNNSTAILGLGSQPQTDYARKTAAAADSQQTVDTLLLSKTGYRSDAYAIPSYSYSADTIILYKGHQLTDTEVTNISAAYTLALHQIDSLLSIAPSLGAFDSSLQKLPRSQFIDTQWYDNGNVFIELVNVGTAIYALAFPHDSSTDSASSSAAMNKRLSNLEKKAAGNPTLGSACLLMGSGVENDDLFMQGLKTFLNTYYETSMIAGASFNLDFLENKISKCNLIFFDAHGLYDKMETSTYIVTGQKMPNEDDLANLIKRDGRYKDCLTRLSTPGNSVTSLAINQHYIARLQKRFNNAFVYSGSCEFLEHASEFGDAFHGKGATAVVGWNEINCSGPVAGDALLRQMLNNCMDVQTAYSNLTYGNQHSCVETVLNPLMMNISESCVSPISCSSGAGTSVITIMHPSQLVWARPEDGAVKLRTDCLKIEFSATPASGPVPLQVQFTATVSPANASVTAWQWDFGDGTSASIQNPSHSYQATGSYTVKLIATGVNDNNTATKTDYITAGLPLGPILTLPSNGTIINQNDQWGIKFKWNSHLWARTGNWIQVSSGSDFSALAMDFRFSTSSPDSADSTYSSYGSTIANGMTCYWRVRTTSTTGSAIDSAGTVWSNWSDVWSFSTQW